MPRSAFVIAIIVSMSVARLATGAPPPDPSGAAVFQQNCAACHSVLAGRNGAGPNLAGLVGRKAGSVPGYAYSAALRGSAIRWTPQELDRYLANPGKAVPGGKMPVSLADPAKRARVIQYLAALK